MGTLSRVGRSATHPDRLAGELERLLATQASGRAPVLAAASRALAHDGWSTPLRRRRATAARRSLDHGYATGTRTVRNAIRG